LSSPLKILQLVHTLDPSGGGVATAVLDLSRGLTKRGHKVDIVVLDDPNAPWLADVGWPVRALGAGITSYRYSSKLLPWLKKHGGDYDRVIVNGMWQYLSFAAWRRYAGSTIPYFVFPHGMLDPWFKESFPLKHLKKWLYWPWSDYRVLRDARAVLFTCEEERRLARESFWLYRCKQEVVGYGIAIPPGDPHAQRNAFYERFPELRQKRIYLYLSRVHPKKGCDFLVQAFAEIVSDQPDAHLLMAGPDDTGWSAELMRLAQGLNLQDRVSWPGMLAGDVKWGAFRVAEVFALPSHQENFGIAVVEAIACGLPVLISDKVNIWREIDEGGAGLIAADTLEGTRTLLRVWNALSQADKAVMRSRTQACFRRHFTIQIATRRLLDVLARETGQAAPMAAAPAAY
jgi:glycosyltransferase involved in cell wall biosynthesis